MTTSERLRREVRVFGENTPAWKKAHEAADELDSLTREVADLKAKLTDLKLSREADDRMLHRLCAFVKTKWPGEAVDILRAVTNTVPNPTQELMAKLAQVEADAAAMREILVKVQRHFNAGWQSNWRDVVGNALANGSGQRLLNELATLRDTAQRRLELLKSQQWQQRFLGDRYCPFCESFESSGHKSTCPLAAELKDAHD